jgi:G3E family GTPase
MTGPSLIPFNLCVCVAQFGEIDIDSSLVAKQEVLEGTNDSIMQLSNGVCV